MAQYKTFMHAAISAEPVNLELVSFLISEGFWIDCWDADGSTLFHKYGCTSQTHVCKHEINKHTMHIQVCGAGR